MIHERQHPSRVPVLPLDDLVNNPQVQYNIGESQKCPVHVPTFLQQNEDDPAIKVNPPQPPMVIADISTAELSPEIEGTFTSSYSGGASPGSRITSIYQVILQWRRS